MPKSPAKAIAAIVKMAVKSVVSKTSTSTTKKKKNKNKKAKTLNMGASGMNIKTAPTQVGVATSSVMKHSTFKLSGKTICASLGTSPTGVVYIGNATGDAGGSTTTRFCVDPLGAGTIAGNFQSFQEVLRNVARSFLQYRVNKFILHYQPVNGTAVNGSVLMGCAAEVSAVDRLASYYELTQFQNFKTSPSWSPMSMDCLVNGGLSREWKNLDTRATIVQAELRQESVGTVFLSAINAPVSAFLGLIHFEYEMEFLGLAPETTIGSTDTAQFDNSASSSVKEDLNTEQSLISVHPVLNHAVSRQDTPHNSPGIPPVAQERWYIPAALPQAQPTR